ncbi:hypothetical protein JKP88DRAFT_267009 [Tribonema minus]|uniref:Uncharacterized protein n=1 Tax=Tribonema minus TaxID=303371 RepID=A0A835ZAQ2_9STRA|nr:hypothetical protein JKP88DRAFT_267009 [Tribonema minus]
MAPCGYRLMAHSIVATHYVALVHLQVVVVMPNIIRLFEVAGADSLLILAATAWTAQNQCPQQQRLDEIAFYKEERTVFKRWLEREHVGAAEASEAASKAGARHKRQAAQAELQVFMHESKATSVFDAYEFTCKSSASSTRLLNRAHRINGNSQRQRVRADVMHAYEGDNSTTQYISLTPYMLARTSRTFIAHISAAMYNGHREWEALGSALRRCRARHADVCTRQGVAEKQLQEEERMSQQLSDSINNLKRTNAAPRATATAATTFTEDATDKTSTASRRIPALLQEKRSARHQRARRESFFAVMVFLWALISLPLTIHAIVAASERANCGAGTGISSTDGQVCCPLSCGACGGEDCHLRFPLTDLESSESCCTDRIVQADKPCGTAPCIITGTAADASEIAGDEQADSESELELQVAEKKRSLRDVLVKCDNGTKCLTQDVKGLKGASASCNKNSVCVCPSGYTWVLEYVETRPKGNIKNGFCPATKAVCPDNKTFCKPTGSTCGPKGICSCPDGYVYKAVDQECVPKSNSPKCSDKSVCKVDAKGDVKTTATCSIDNRCVCVGRNVATLLDNNADRKVQCYCGDSQDRTSSTCGTNSKCCGPEQRCFATVGNKNTRACGDLLQCAKNRQPCGQSRPTGTLPTPSTTCCETNEVCVLDPANKVRQTKCVTKKSCPGKRQACGRTGQYIDAPYSAYHEFTKDTFCCATGEECWFSKRGGATKCIKPITCPAGIESCGHTENYETFRDDKELYYGEIRWGHPDDKCCKAGEKHATPGKSHVLLSLHLNGASKFIEVRDSIG